MVLLARNSAHEFCQTLYPSVTTSAREPSGPTKKHMYSVPPLIIQSHLNDFDGRIEITNHSLDGGMKTEGRAYQIKERWRMAQLDALEVPALLKLAAVLQPADAQPIVKPLHGQIDLLMHFQFDHSQAPATRHPQNVNDAPVSRGKCRNLWIDAFGHKFRINSRNVPQEKTLKPAL